MTDVTSLARILTAINTGGVIAVLVFALWLGLRGDVVTLDQLNDCRKARDLYQSELLRYRIPVPPTPTGG